MPRYLFFMSYIGSRFRGVQRQLPHNLEDPSTVQGCIELAFRWFEPLLKPIVVSASRTDKGVHALKSAFHIDLEPPEGGKPFSPDTLTYQLNKHFEKQSIAIWIQKCQQVPDHFNSRAQAVRRTYLYRLAARRKDAPPLERHFQAQIPYAEWRRCHLILQQDFDIDKFKQAAQLLVGTHDFRTFMGSVNNVDDSGINTVRELKSFDISPGHSVVPSRVCDITSQYDFWDVTCSSKSFLFRQVRRMVGASIAVARGRLQFEDIERMLAEPGKDSWNPRATLAPPYGLYLANIEFDQEDLKIQEVTQVAKSESTVTEIRKRDQSVFERNERQIG